MSTSLTNDKRGTGKRNNFGAKIEVILYIIDQPAHASSDESHVVIKGRLSFLEPSMLVFSYYRSDVSM